VAGALAEAGAAEKTAAILKPKDGWRDSLRFRLKRNPIPYLFVFTWFLPARMRFGRSRDRDYPRAGRTHARNPLPQLGFAAYITGETAIPAWPPAAHPLNKTRGK
jgi:hypothetical protein